MKHLSKIQLQVIKVKYYQLISVYTIGNNKIEKSILHCEFAEIFQLNNEQRVTLLKECPNSTHKGMTYNLTYKETERKTYYKERRMTNVALQER